MVCKAKCLVSWKTATQKERLWPYGPKLQSEEIITDVCRNYWRTFLPIKEHTLFCFFFYIFPIERQAFELCSPLSELSKVSLPYPLLLNQLSFLQWMDLNSTSTSLVERGKRWGLLYVIFPLNLLEMRLEETVIDASSLYSAPNNCS